MFALFWTGVRSKSHALKKISWPRSPRTACAERTRLVVWECPTAGLRNYADESLAAVRYGPLGARF